MTVIKTDTIMCTIKNSYATKDMLIYVNFLTINFLLTKIRTLDDSIDDSTGIYLFICFILFFI